MKLFLIFTTAITLVAAGSRSYRSESRRHSRDSERRAALDYEDIQTANQEDIDRFDETSENRKSSRSGIYTAGHGIQVTNKSKAQRRHSKAPGAKDSEASGTHFEGTHFGAYGTPQVQQIHTHELLTNQGLLPLYQPAASGGGNIVLTGGLGLADQGAHHGHQLLYTAGSPSPGPFLANPEAVGHAHGDFGTDITKSVYVFSAPPDPYDYVPRNAITKIPQRQQKHYQVLFINAPSPPPQVQHTVELPPPQDLKTLVYVLVKKPERAPPINFIKPGAPHPHKPEVYFIRYKNRGYGLSPSPVGPLEETIPVGHGHPGVAFSPLAHPQEELRGNLDYGPGLQSQYDGPPAYALEEYQDDAHLAASSVMPQRSSAREVDAGVSGI